MAKDGLIRTSAGCIVAHYRSFTNQKCEFYPCHKSDKLNCLFCFCPLYFLDCGGKYTLTSRGLKDCSECLLPHTDAGYDYIVQKLTEAAERHGCRPEDSAGSVDEAPDEDWSGLDEDRPGPDEAPDEDRSGATDGAAPDMEPEPGD